MAQPVTRIRQWVGAHPAQSTVLFVDQCILTWRYELTTCDLTDEERALIYQRIAELQQWRIVFAVQQRMEGA